MKKNRYWCLTLEQQSSECLKETDDEAIEFFLQAFGYHLTGIWRETFPLVANGYRQYVPIFPNAASDGLDDLNSRIGYIHGL